MFGVDVSWDRLHESGTDDQVRLECLDSLAHGRLARSYLEEGLVALVYQSFIDLLGEAIVSGREKHDFDFLSNFLLQ